MRTNPSKKITTTVTVSTVTPRPGGGSFFTGQDHTGKWIRAKVDYDCLPDPPNRGETWKLIGELIFHEKYRYQLHVEHCELVSPTGRLLIQYLCNHPAFRGIGLGVAKATKLYKKFADELAVVIEKGDTVSLTEVLTQETAEKLVAAWRANAQELSVIAFLNKHKINLRLARKILSYWGAGAVEKLCENPYRLLIIANWDEVDKLAKGLQVLRLDPRRLVAATETFTYRRLDLHKDTLTDEKSLKNGISQLINASDEETAQRALSLALQEGAVVGDSSRGFQPLGCAFMEQYLARRFNSLLTNSRGSQLDLFGTEGANLLVDAHIGEFENKEGICLNPEQRRAVHMAATSSLAVIKGGAGVGKTTVLKVIHQVAEAMRASVFQMALAGRAAQRMRETTGKDAYTIIGFLNRIKNGQIKLGYGDLIVIDESSMLDLILVYRLMRVLPEEVRLLFVGDPYQLPPIGPGLVFHILADSTSVPMVELTQVHRQAESTGIPLVASQVRKGVIPEFVPYRGAGYGVSFIDCRQYEIVEQLINIMSDLGGFQEAQILGAIKSGPAGVSNINSTFHKINTAAQPQLRAWDIAESDLVIYTVNDYERELFNGSLGYVEKVLPTPSVEDTDKENSARAIVNFEGRSISLSNEDMGNVEWAYAITVHKAQGSQFKRVIIPITESGLSSSRLRRFLDRTLIYTALTRGIEQVIFIGSQKAFAEAIVNEPSVRMRQVGFAL